MLTSKSPLETNVEGFGTFKIRCLKAREAMAFQKMEGEQYVYATLAATVLDAQGAAVFASPEAVAEADWALVRELRAAYLKVNNLSVEAASGN
jgi:hypothetical protein